MAVISGRRGSADSGRAAGLAGAALWFLLVAGGCASSQHASLSKTPEAPGADVSASVFAQHVVSLIEARDISELAGLVDPAQGIVFSPYGHVDADHAVTLLPSALASAWTNNEFFIWGRYDGTGEPIALATRDYFDRFVYDKEFSAAPEVAVDRVIGRGNTLVNHEEVFGDATMVEFHVPGTDPRFGGMDWASLRVLLVPAPEGGWWLRALVHDQWTI